mgnify:CR=1 FL=1
MSTIVAIVKSLVGQVFAVSLDGLKRQVFEGERLLMGEQILTGLGGEVTLQLANGDVVDVAQNSSWQAAPGETQADAEKAQTNPDLEQALAAGFDPTTDLEATAAGPAAAGGGGGGSYLSPRAVITGLTQTAGQNAGNGTAAIIGPRTSTEIVRSPGAYTWPRNGVSYRSSGLYVWVDSVNAITRTLDLRITSLSLGSGPSGPAGGSLMAFRMRDERGAALWSARREAGAYHES